uniref:G-protein coupled receptors family 1 profile domain-containing protein n=1 Tax=Erpetoichthys calabaricus TaxID=27687 RepID=A0A8C4XD07_ERPCA
MSNATVFVSEFVLHCEITSEIRSFTVVALAIIYLTTLFGNLLIILVIILDHHLQTPMFLCIGALAVIDVLQSTNVIPKMMALLLFDTSPIPYGACLLQMLLVFHLQTVEALLFTLMAYDRFFAVIYPLRYPQLVTGRTVWVGVLVCNIISGMPIIVYLIFITELSFCRTNVLPYCFCDYSTMVHVSCNENAKYFNFLSTIGITFGSTSLTVILISYGKIAHVALKISSKEGKKKVFNTLSSHLLVVGLFNIPLLTSYLLPGTGVKLTTEAYNTMVIVSIIVPPMLNPIIYSFRNKEIKTGICTFIKGIKAGPEIIRN